MNYSQVIKQQNLDDSPLSSYKLSYEEHRKPKSKGIFMPSQEALDCWITLSIETFLLVLIVMVRI